MTGGAPRTTRAVEAAARIVLRPVGNPLPLGFLALAGGTLLVSGLRTAARVATTGICRRTRST